METRSATRLLCKAYLLVVVLVKFCAKSIASRLSRASPVEPSRLSLYALREAIVAIKLRLITQLGGGGDGVAVASNERSLSVREHFPEHPLLAAALSVPRRVDET